MPLKVCLVNQHCEKGALTANLAATTAAIAAAAARGVDIVAFPEMSLSGYIDPELNPEAVLRLDGPEIASLLERTRGYPGAVLVGLVEHNPAGKPFITQIVARDGALLGFYRKNSIYDEETEWFSPGDTVPVFQHGELTFGVAICADLTNPSVYALCKEGGARVVFELAAPGLYGDQSTRNWQSGYAWWEGECRQHLTRYARDLGLWVLVATQAGRTVDEDFPGGAYVFAPGGERLFATPDWQPGMVFLEIDLEAGTVRELA